MIYMYVNAALRSNQLLHVNVLPSISRHTAAAAAADRSAIHLIRSPKQPLEGMSYSNSVLGPIA